MENTCGTSRNNAQGSHDIIRKNLKICEIVEMFSMCLFLCFFNLQVASEIYEHEFYKMLQKLLKLIANDLTRKVKKLF